MYIDEYSPARFFQAVRKIITYFNIYVDCLEYGPSPFMLIGGPTI